jgi:hypothetical protein
MFHFRSRSTRRIVRILRNTIHNASLVEASVQLLQNQAQYISVRNCDQQSNSVYCHSGNESSGILIHVHETGIDTGGITDGVNEGDGRGTFGSRTRESIADPSQTDDVSGIASHGHQHHSHVTGGEFGCGCRDNEGDNAENKRHGNMEKPFPGTIRVQGIEESRVDSENVRRDRQEQGLNIRLLKSCSNLKPIGIHLENGLLWGRNS